MLYSIEANNVLECLEKVHQLFDEHPLYYGHGTDNAWDEACWLVETVLKRNGQVEFNKDTPVSGSQLLQVNQLVQKRVESRQPLAYLLEEAWFANLCFHIDARVLIPRSPIAELILNGFAGLLSNPPKRILDLCTGSGCIGIAAALAFPEASVDLADISNDALEIAFKNINKYKLKQRVKIINSDLFESIDKRYDLIISNPPYVSIDEYQALPEEYLQEPRLGLVSEENGLALPLKIIKESAGYLEEEGVLVLEVGYSWQSLVERLPDFPMRWIEFEAGGEGVCMLSLEQLSKYKV